MRSFIRKNWLIWRQSGVSAVIVAIALLVLVGFAALVIDLGFAYAERNRIQNAADAGALAGARKLYADNGQSIHTRAFVTAEAEAVATQNVSTGTYVVDKGHYSFGMGSLSRGFQVNNDDSLGPVPLWDVTDTQLDENPNFINAVRVTAAVNAPSFFSRIWSYAGFTLSVNAVAYVGFAGSVEPAALDQPIAICKEAIQINTEGGYTCGVGRMINSGSNPGHETGGWTNFSQPCQTATPSSVKPLVCKNGNPYTVTFGQGIGTIEGQTSAYQELFDCWQVKSDSNADGIPDKPWEMMLAVIDCPSNNVGPCSNVVGVVELNLLWMTQEDKNQFKEVPRSMKKPDGTQWTCTTTATTKEAGQQCWSEFVAAFNLKDVLNNSPAIYEDKTIYYLPDCKAHEPTGTTGGKNYGILAKIPVLVQ